MDLGPFELEHGGDHESPRFESPLSDFTGASGGTIMRGMLDCGLPVRKQNSSS